ncbi:MAG: right-handed parallel beta-helix repeat-containing protein [Burkholderiaceae bacterium]|nr:right-handed parallel beta-helix repeat-containing protein [Burkholderiaceae bacterium]
MQAFRPLLLATLISAGLAGCGGGGDSPAPSTPAAPVVQGTVVKPSQMNAEDLNTIFFQARPGDTITLPAGKYTINKHLALTVDNVTIVGGGNGNDPSKDTILSFKNASESNGLEVRNVKGITLRKFAVEDSVGNAVFVSDSKDVIMDTLRTEWTTDPVNTSLMAYGLYPVASDNVQVLNSKAIGTRDAGVYVGQSTNIRVAGNEAYYNVAGIEIENSKNAIVEDNYVHENTGGILVFALPGTYRFKDNVGTLVRNNRVINNNQRVASNASGFVTAVPPGTGMLILAAQDTEITGNTITNHKTTGILAVSFQATGFSYDARVYDPHLRGLYAHRNVITDFGSAPAGLFADPAGLKPVVDGLFGFLRANGLPAKLAAVAWDGIVDATTGTTGPYGNGGSYTGNQRICSKDNTLDTITIPGTISYENLDLDLIGLMAGVNQAPNFPFPARMNCELTLPTVTGKAS